MKWIPPRAVIGIWITIILIPGLFGCSPQPAPPSQIADTATPTRVAAWVKTSAPTPGPTIAPSNTPEITPSNTPTAQPTEPMSDADLIETLDQEIERIFNQSNSPGLAVGVVRDHELIYARGFGVTNLETGDEVTPRTLFHMASITKPFVATSIVQLYEQGKLSLDDPVVQHLPYFEINDERSGMLTIRQFLTHSSGMPDVEDYQWENPQYDEGALERYVRSISGRELLQEPGRHFSYSNLAFEVLGDLIAKVSGQSFADYVKDNILLPLGMNDSSILIEDVDPALLAHGYIEGDNGEVLASGHFAYNRRHGPSSTLHSNIVDMSRWAIANMNRGELEGSQILDAASYDLLWEPSVMVGVRDGRRIRLGLSWFLSRFGGQPTVYHGGADIGYRTNLVMVPDAGAAVIVLSNFFSPDSPVEEVTQLALELLVGPEWGQ